MTTIESITQAMRDVTPDEIRARLIAIDAEGRLLRQLLRAALQREHAKAKVLDAPPSRQKVPCAE